MLNTWIGIDPGEHTGVAVYDSKNGLRLYTETFWSVIELIELYSVKQFTIKSVMPHFFVENPGLNGFMYQQKINNQNAASALKIAQNVGQNKGDAKRIIEYINKKQMLLTEVRPEKASQKWTSEYFQSLMRGRFDINKSNEHTRDAAKLISGFWTQHKIQQQPTTSL